MGLSNMIALQPLLCFILLVIVVISIPSFMIPHWYQITKRVKDNIVELDSTIARAQVMSQIQDTARLLLPMNSSSIKLAHILNLNLTAAGHKQHVSFPLIQDKVAPAMFQALTTIPHLSQISYIGLDGLFFSYYTDGNQTRAIYSNTSFTPSYAWYTQPVNYSTNTGVLLLNGQPTVTKPIDLVDTPWFRNATTAPNGYASLGSTWHNGNKRRLLFNAVRVGNLRGVVSLGFDAEIVASFFSSAGVRDHGYGASRLYIVTNEGEMLLEGIPRTKVIVGGLGNKKMVSVELLVEEGEEEVLVHVGDVSCAWEGSSSMRRSKLEAVFNVGGKTFEFYCSSLDVLGLNTVYILAFPHQAVPDKVHKDIKKALALLIFMLLGMALSISASVYLVVKGSRREMYLCAALIKQWEATQQAERKSLKKTLAVAGASHDVRNSLVAIKASLQHCFNDAAPGSELEEKLREIEESSDDLLIMLNNILDTSKIDSGKMDLKEVEFSLPQTLERVADSFYPLAMEKGVDVILDTCDGSAVLKLPNIIMIKGDRGKLERILRNLLSNAVKFTSEGHVTMRAWVRKPSFENEIIVSNQDTFLHKVWHWFARKEHTSDHQLTDHRAITTTVKQLDPNCMEFVFEVEDTGEGIPKEKREIVFENFVQLKETADGKGGTGLGLGNVQSFVRLMGGDIAVVDKEGGGRGACFRFNVFFIVPPSSSSLENHNEVDVEPAGELHPPNPAAPSTRPLGPKSERSLVVLLIQNEGRRKVVQKYMEGHGIRVVAIKKADHLPSLLKKIEMNPSTSLYCSSGRSSCRWAPSLCLSGSFNSTLWSGGEGARGTPPRATEGADNSPRVHSQRGEVRNFSCILLVLDANAGDFQNLARSVVKFRKDLNIRTVCKIVWLENPTSRKLQSYGLEQESLAPTDVIMTRPLHGSRLLKVIRLLPEFGGDKVPVAVSPLKMPRINTTMHVGSGNYPILSHNRIGLTSDPHGQGSSGAREEIGSSGRQQRIRKQRALPVPGETQKQSKQSSAAAADDIEKSLLGKKILLAEDNPVISKWAMLTLKKMGASVKPSENGEQTLALVRQGLEDQTCLALPYDYILMDCEMPLMDGFEATRQIRKEEGKYGIHIPIIALTAHGEEEGNRMKEAGMDFLLTKPLKKDELLEAIRYIHQQWPQVT